MLSNLVARTQLIDSKDLSSAESFSKQVHCPHLSAEHTVDICRLRRSQETLVKCLQREEAGREEGITGAPKGKNKNRQKKKKKKRYDARKEIRGDDRWGWVNKTKRERKKKREIHTDVNSSFKAEILRMIRSRLLQEANLLSATSTGLHYTVMAQ